MEFEKVIYDRYSVRSFKPEQIKTDKLDKILEAFRIAPTAKNSQSQRIKVITDHEGLALIDECTPCRYGAPAVLLICYDNTKCPLALNGLYTGETDCGIATDHIMLRAWDLGIGSCWVQHFDANLVKKHFKLPKNIVPVSLLPIGYASESCKTSTNHGKRLPLKDLLI